MSVAQSPSRLSLSTIGTFTPSPTRNTDTSLSKSFPRQSMPSASSTLSSSSSSSYSFSSPRLTILKAPNSVSSFPPPPSSSSPRSLDRSTSSSSANRPSFSGFARSPGPAIPEPTNSNVGSGYFDVKQQQQFYSSSSSSSFVDKNASYNTHHCAAPHILSQQDIMASFSNAPTMSVNNGGDSNSLGLKQLNQDILVPFIDRPSELHDLLSHPHNVFLLDALRQSLGPTQFDNDLLPLLHKSRDALPDSPWLEAIKNLIYPKNEPLWLKFCQTIGYEHQFDEYTNDANGTATKTTSYDITSLPPPTTTPPVDKETPFYSQVESFQFPPPETKTTSTSIPNKELTTNDANRTSMSFQPIHHGQDVLHSPGAQRAFSISSYSPYSSSSSFVSERGFSMSSISNAPTDGSPGYFNSHDFAAIPASPTTRAPTQAHNYFNLNSIGEEEEDDETQDPLVKDYNKGNDNINNDNNMLGLSNDHKKKHEEGILGLSVSPLIDPYSSLSIADDDENPSKQSTHRSSSRRFRFSFGPADQVCPVKYT